MERQRGPDPDYDLGDLQLHRGWEEDEREEAERERQATRKPKPKRFGTAADIEALEAVCGKPYEGNEAAWDAVMKVVKLPLCYQPAVREALAQHRWRNASNPIGYVKSVAMRVGLKSGVNIPDWHGKPKTEVCNTSALGDVWDKNELYRDKGYSQQAYIDMLQNDPSECLEDPDESYLETKLAEMSRLGLVDDDGEIDWAKIGKRAGLNRENSRVFSLKAKGLGRDAALETARTEIGRKKLQAAWRELEPDRKGETILANVREVLRGREIQKSNRQGKIRQRSYVSPAEALQAARKRQMTPVVHDTYETSIKKSYHLRWLQTI
jgi:hypothetical protein